MMRDLNIDSVLEVLRWHFHPVVGDEGKRSRRGCNEQCLRGGREREATRG